MQQNKERRRITIAILALGGQGGGVLADWIVGLSEQNDYVAQGTSVPGVAQRTGSTIYYVELYPRAAIPPGAPEPVLSLMPASGDVDIVIASELMETGRAILRGFVNERTTLIGSTHRIYAIAEKSAMSDGRASGERILQAANDRAARFIGFDMDKVATSCGSVISAVMLGALAGSGALPFGRDPFEAAIRNSGKAVQSNLAAFAAGFDSARYPVAEAIEKKQPVEPTSSAGRALLDRLRADFPEAVHDFAAEGIRRMMDYQDAPYAGLYLDRLAGIRAVDSEASGWQLTREAARYLALWMSYEDTIRVADLKVRASRFNRVRDEVGLKPDQLIEITEYMHPRLEEICETLPAALGRRILASDRISRLAQPFFRRGRHVSTNKFWWFFLLWSLASMRRWRRGTLRYQVEQERIERWLELVRVTAPRDPEAAAELVECQRLIKGYGDTHARGLKNYSQILDVFEKMEGQANSAATIRRLRLAALADEEGRMLSAELAELKLAS